MYAKCYKWKTSFHEFQFIIILISISQKARECIHKSHSRIFFEASCELFSTFQVLFIMSFSIIFACMHVFS